MSWYKKAYELSDFGDRNRLNARIRDFKDIVTRLQYLRQYIAQNPPDAKAQVYELLQDKRLNAIPSVKKALRAANHKALDNYIAFELSIVDAMDALVIEVEKMEKERNKFIQKGLS